MLSKKKGMFFAFIIAFFTLILSNATYVFAKDIDYPATNEAVVYTSLGFKTALESSNITKIYLGSDIEITHSGIIVNTANKKEIIVDGINPYGTDKTKHTLTEYKQSRVTRTAAIRITTKGKLEQMIMQNMNIVGQNVYGTVNVDDSVYYMIQVYKNIDYTGPRLGYSDRGTVSIVNSNITLVDMDSTAKACEAARAAWLYLGGDVNIKKVPANSYYEIFVLTGHGTTNTHITVSPNANVKIENGSYSILNTTDYSGFMHSETPYRFEIGEGASFEYKGYRNFLSKVPIKDLVINENATVKIEIEGCPSTGAYNGWVDAPVITVTDSIRVRSNSDVSFILKNNKSTHPTILMKDTVTFDINDPKRFLIYNNSQNAIKNSSTNPLNTFELKAANIAYYKAENLDINNLGTPNLSWQNSANFHTNIITINATADNNGGYTRLTLSNYDNSGPALNSTTFNTAGVKVISLSQNSKPVNNNYTINFNTDGGLPVPNNQTVKSGEKVTRPTDPIKNDFMFDGWYTDNTFKTKWDFDNNIVTSNLNLIAKWSQSTTKKYLVRFDADGGTPEPDDQKVIAGQRAIVPNSMTKKDFTFEGWYTDSRFIMEWDFNDSVNNDLDLIAKWTPLNNNVFYTVSFVTTGGSKVDPITDVKYGSTIAMPEPPKKPNDCFSGWFLDQNFEKRWIFSKDKVYSDITLYAKWCYEN